MKRKRFSTHLLRTLRNRIPIADLITDEMDLPSKESEGYLRFLCPVCSEFNTATNPLTNLARCFRCRRNFNPIDIVMAVQKCSFVEAVESLKGLLPRYTTSWPDPTRSANEPQPLCAKLSETSEVK
jgi:DNA primase